MRTNLCLTKLQIFFRNIGSYFECLRLDTKLILVYIMILAIPVMVFGFYSFQTVKNSIESDALRTSRRTVEKAKADIYRNISLCDSVIQYITRHREFIDFIGAKKDYTVAELLEFKNNQFYSVENLQIINSDINQIRLFLGNSQFPEIWPVIYNEKRVYGCDWRREVLKLKNGGVLWRLNHRDDVSFMNKTNDNQLVSAYREVRNSDNEYVGIIEVNMLAEVFFGELYHQPANDSVITYLLDNQYQLHSFTNSRLSQNLLPDLKEVKAELSKNTQSGEGSFTLKIKRQSLLVVYTYIKTIDSYIYQITSPKALTQKIDRIRNLIFLGSFGALLLLSLITYLITGIILKKMRIIIASMRKVEEGNFNVEISIRGVDEIGELAYHFRKMLRKINELIAIVVKKQVAVKDAEIRALQSQINAHFIYNVLEAIKMMAEIDGKYQISDAIAALGSMMRYNMNWSRHYVLLEEEINYVRDYITITNIRYDDEITLCIDVGEKQAKQEIMKMLLQPLIENAVNHGLHSKRKGGMIKVTAYSDGELLHIEVWDNGVGMDQARLDEVRKHIYNPVESVSDGESYQGHSIALKNVNERIKLFYGNEFGIEIFSECMKYTKVHIRLPLIQPQSCKYTATSPL